MNTFRTLRRRYGRTTLITIGIALAIAFSTIMLSIGEAIQKSTEDIIEETGVDLLIEPPTDLPPIILEFLPIFEITHGREIAEAMMKNNSKIRAASPMLVKNLYMAKEPEEINVSNPPKFTISTFKGTIPENNKYFSAVKTISGEPMPTQSDPFYANGTYQEGKESKNFTHEIQISKKLSRLLEISVGETIYINPVSITDEFSNRSLSAWFENATWFKVYSIIDEIYESQNALTAHLHLSELQYITGNYKNDVVHKIYVSLHDKSDREEVKSWLKNEFIYRDRISVHTPEDLVEDISEFTKMFEGFSRMVVIITVLIAILFISTVLMISTRERSNEIGALRAIGLSKTTINKFILKESFIICLLALIIGLILGFISSGIINNYIVTTQPFLPAEFKVTLITPGLIAQVTIISIIIALLASLGPCYWAMRLKPVESLRNE